MKIGIDKGHTLTGLGTGAVGKVKETDKNREVGNILITMLKEKGHTVVDCTVDKSSNDLADRVKKANAQELDILISIHLNSFSNENANGVETYSYRNSGTGYNYAKRVQAELVKIGWQDRNVKQANFYMLKNTKAPAILVELGFVSNKKDMDLFNSLEVAKRLFKGITGEEYKTNVAEQKPTTSECGDIHRVRVDGVQVGAYKNHDSIAKVVKENLGKSIEVK